MITDSTATFHQLLHEIVNGLGVVLAAIGSAALIVGGTISVNIMLVAVTEPAHWIRIRNALGLRPRNITFRFLSECATVILMGGAVGVLYGIVIATLVTLVTAFLSAIEFWSNLRASW
jgi:putative ABC transport system permease protein